MSAPKPPITFWSFSALKKFEACPYRLYLERVEKAPQPEIGDDPDHPLTRGKHIHKAAEDYIKGETEKLDKTLKRFAEPLADLAERYARQAALSEQRWIFNRQWQESSWESPDKWLIEVPDALYEDDGVLHIIDFKTGKSFGKEVSHTQQLQLYAITALMRYPGTEHVRAEAWYIDEGKSTTRSYTRAVLPTFIPRWQARGERLTNALAFPAKPNFGNCKFCPYSPNEAGNGRCAVGAEVTTKKVRSC